jgi:hypothetical protein
LIVEALEYLGVSEHTEAANQAQVVSAAIACIAAIIAVGAVIAAILQVRAAHAAQRETLARQAYNDYIKLCFNEPAFACGDWQKSSDKLPQDLLFEKYEWFVSIMLNACEAILLHVPNKGEWLETIQAQIGYHSTYIRSQQFQKNCALHYSIQLRKPLAEA